ncbi:hypothetical protein HYDPIDRAFT_104635 [Hydnomerulius pinastri MD-312]|nr:hypothetical protein HYDPIDRAFT_104635 [Hydnomerulius pinastri MD-312]
MRWIISCVFCIICVIAHCSQALAVPDSINHDVNVFEAAIRTPFPKPTDAHTIVSPQASHPALTSTVAEPLTRSIEQATPPTSAPFASHTPTNHNGYRHKFQLVSLIFIVLGGVSGVLITFFFLRCWYSYYKTPRQDRIATLLHRYNLEREMAERERLAGESRRWSLPPPPYQPPPPHYSPIGPPPLDSPASPLAPVSLSG